MADHRKFLIFPNQLTKASLSLPKDEKVVLVEAPWYFRSPTATKAQLVTYRAALQALRERFLVKGYEVEYLDAASFPTFAAMVDHLASAGLTSVATYPFTGKREEAEVLKHLAVHAITLTVQPCTTYLVQDDWLTEMGDDVRTEARFTSWLRRKLGILVDASGNPEGGSWKLPQAPKRKYELQIPQPERNRYVEEAATYVAAHFPRVRGGVAGVPSPITFADAEDQLEYVFEGDWLAAPEPIAEKYVMPSVELGLIPPSHVVKRLMQKHVQVAAKEAFLRPLLKREWQRLKNRGS